MSWELIVMPLAEIAADDDGWDWFTTLPIAGLPAERPTAEPHFTIAQATDALRDSGVRGQCWPAIDGVADFLLPEERGSAVWGTGDVSFMVEGRELRDPRAATDVVKAVFLHKPHPASALVAACAMARDAALVVFDPDMTGVCIPRGASPADVETDWPWT